MNIAVVFPGQGSQSVGMLAEYADETPIVLDTFKEASEALGYDLWDIVSNGPIEKLNSTEITQPAILAADIAVMRIMSVQCMQKPVAFAGHSLGEYAALVASGALDFVAAIKLVAKRGQLMQSAVPEGAGAMAAVIGLNDSDVVKICQDISKDDNEVVEAVNFNSPGQVVIAGSSGAVEKAVTLLKEAGAKRVLPLPVSVPSHSSLMKPAADELEKYLSDIELEEPDIEVLHNVDAKSHNDTSLIKQALVKQLYNPVLWSQTIKILSEGVDTIVECGPGKVLSGLTKRINKDVKGYSLNTPDAMNTFLDSM
jgi:[acyl-carrier-protein] S-malonyltransferase